MNKKYFPFVALLAAVLLFIWVKQNQRGKEKDPTSVKTNVQPLTEDFDRSVTKLTFSKHAKCNMECRHIDESEVKDILEKGEINYEKIKESEKGMTYPLEGITRDKQHVRIVFAPHQNEMVVVTAIDLDTEWPCDCK